MSRRRPNPQDPEIKTGSPAPGEPAFLAVGRFRRTHGVAGEIMFEVLTDFPERLGPGRQYYVGDLHRPLLILSRRPVEKGLLLTLEGYTDVDQVAALTNEVLYVRSDSLPPLPEGEFYFHQLLGMRVEDGTGQVLGRIAEILETGANNVYVVKSEEGNELLIPAVEPFVQEIDLEKGVMRINPPEWL
jgi:16S rRNA processing protein RimM